MFRVVACKSYPMRQLRIGGFSIHLISAGHFFHPAYTDPMPLPRNQDPDHNTVDPDSPGAWNSVSTKPRRMGSFTKKVLFGQDRARILTIPSLPSAWYLTISHICNSRLPVALCHVQHTGKKSYMAGYDCKYRLRKYKY